MHDPIGAFQRIRELYLSYLDTAFRIEDPTLAEERQSLLRRPGQLCTSPLLLIDVAFALGGVHMLWLDSGFEAGESDAAAA